MAVMKHEDFEYCFDNIKHIVDFASRLGIQIYSYKMSAEIDDVSITFEAKFYDTGDSFKRKMKKALVKKFLEEMDKSEQ